MNKVELVATLATKTGVQKTDVEKVVEAFTDTVTETLKSGGEVVIAGFGAFLAKDRAAREGVDPRDPTKKIQIPAVRVAKFKVGVNLKKALRS